MCKTGGDSSIPPLLGNDGIWAVKPKTKADLLADAFLSKAVLPPEVPCTSPKVSPANGCHMSGFLPVRLRHVVAELQGLRADSSTGPDEISARYLKACFKAIAFPLTLLTRAIVHQGVWPQAWRIHRLLPLHKKKAKSDPVNYRGIHITAQLSKVVERVLGRLFLPFLEISGAYGPNQFAYTHGRGLHDALALNTLRWIQSISAGKRVGLYCSDVSGAFDRVSSEKLVRKLSERGVHRTILAVIQAWLEPRSAVVVVDGARSRQRVLHNSVYQGTVWGPPLWNTYFADAAAPLNGQGFSETMFADDLNAYREFGPTVPNHVVLGELRECQAQLHSWGATQQILFDGSKESFHILARSDSYGDVFKFLGVTFDTKLTMHNACMEIAAQGHCRARTILRLRPYYSTAQLLSFYRSQVLSYIEVFTAAVHHANHFFLSSIDRVQGMFLQELGITEETALFDFHLAPLAARRDIAMLGFLHKIALRQAPPSLLDVFPLGCSRSPRSLRGNGARHANQLLDPIDGCQSAAMERSAFGKIYVYNLLPKAVAEQSSTKTFQRMLQQGLKSACRAGVLNWPRFLSDGVRNLSAEAFQQVLSN